MLMKEFWSFVGRRTKGRKGGVEALRNDSGVSVYNYIVQRVN